MNFYKVVRKGFNPGEFFSYSFYKDSSLCLTYRIDITTIPQTDSLGVFVFNDLELAKKYCSADKNNAVILEGEGVVKTPLPRYIFNGKVHILAFSIKDFEEKALHPTKKYYKAGFYTEPIDGTVLLSEFTPRRIVL